MNFSQAIEKLDGKTRKTLRANLVLRREKQPPHNGRAGVEFVALELHGHRILSWYPDGDIEVSTCGYHTPTTLRAINEYGPIRLHRHAGKLYYTTPDKQSTAFIDGMTFDEWGEPKG